MKELGLDVLALGGRAGSQYLALASPVLAMWTLLPVLPGNWDSRRASTRLYQFAESGSATAKVVFGGGCLVER